MQLRSLRPAHTHSHSLTQWLTHSHPLTQTHKHTTHYTQRTAHYTQHTTHYTSHHTYTSPYLWIHMMVQLTLFFRQREGCVPTATGCIEVDDECRQSISTTCDVWIASFAIMVVKWICEIERKKKMRLGVKCICENWMCVEIMKTREMKEKWEEQDKNNKKKNKNVWYPKP